MNIYGVERLGRDKYHVQYRINKKGAQCFLTGNFEEAKAKLDELSAKRPGIYTMQRRSVKLDKYGFETPQPLEKTGWF